MHVLTNVNAVLDRKINKLVAKKEKVEIKNPFLNRSYKIFFIGIPFILEILYLIAINNYNSDIETLKKRSGEIFDYVIMELSRRSNK